MVEVVLSGVPATRAERERCHLSEEIVRYKQSWFTVQDNGPAVLPTLLALRRPIRDVTVPAPLGAPNPAGIGAPDGADDEHSPDALRIYE